MNDIMDKFVGYEQQILKLKDEIVELRAENGRLRGWRSKSQQKRLRVQGVEGELERLHAEIRQAFREGFDYGVDDTFNAGKITCPELYEETLERAWQDYTTKQTDNE